MKTAVRVVLSLGSSTVFVFAIAWIYVGHFLPRQINIAEQNVGLVIWSATGISIGAVVGLTVALYRVIR